MSKGDPSTDVLVSAPAPVGMRPLPGSPRTALA